MIDCVHATQPSPAMRCAIRDYLATAPPNFESVNQTNYTPLIERPIGVTLNVKRAGGDPDKAVVQCAVWAAAQFNRLERLVAGVREAQILERHEAQLQLQEQEHEQEQEQEPEWPPPSLQSTFSPTPLPQRIGDMSLDNTTTSLSSTSTTVTGDTSTTTPPTTNQAPSPATGVLTLGADHGPASAPAMVSLLPIVIAHGHNWHFLAVTRSGTGRTVSSLQPLLFLASPSTLPRLSLLLPFCYCRLA